MRYVNETQGPVYNALAGQLVNPGGRTREIADLAKTANLLADRCGRLSIVLSADDFKALERLMSKVGVDRDRLRRAIDKGRTDPRSEKAVYEENESLYVERQRRLSEDLREHREKEARINAESNFILPDGTPVGKDEANVVQGMRVKEGTEIEPRIVERPMSPLDILAHNAKVSTDRAQTKPLSGKAAVEAYKGVAPGMPNFPGIEKQMENLAKEKAIADAQKAGTVKQVSSADMIASGERNNYGRKP